MQWFDVTCLIMFVSIQIWYNAVLRGDTDTVTIGQHTNVQDRAMIVTHLKGMSHYPAKVTIGDYVTIGHGASLTSCTIGRGVLIGQGSIIDMGCVVEDNVTIAAGAVLLIGQVVPSGQLWGGNPAEFMRDLTADEIAGLEKV